jgi:phage-related holin
MVGPRTILITFITADVVATMLQIVGAAMIGAAESKGTTFFLPVWSPKSIFVGLLTLFIAKARKPLKAHKLMEFVGVLMGAVLLILIRAIFRLAGTAQGVFGYISSHEVFFGVLEFVPIVVVVALLAVYHPTAYVGGKLDKDQDREGK